jgi:nucleoside-diphosphate-sugar epimerase
MAGSKVLVLGGTGPAGICVVRELLHRKIGTMVFCRSPDKIPEDLANNTLLEVRKQTLYLLELEPNHLM